MQVAIYPGSFDPVTYGHLDIIHRSAKIFEHLIIGVLRNSAKNPLFSVEERVTMLEETTKDLSNVEVRAFSGLLADFAGECGCHVVVRGLRAITDFEYELQLSQTNRIINKELDTVFLNTDLRYSYLSSTTVREIAMYHGELKEFVPEYVAERLQEKFR
ncbi:pantetheine-phosphate adenylyltransferase [Lachnotalea sp. AF33-28]|jgi:pantetheine-phosphate adenylyltransferase|uniref:pantetheine-phosphate adenylyltransferase n=1 Tax=Lachnotalea sp. AF33-28 TaxID=2292046 RepID=UPI000E549DE3|nr:pantetheine-phosphate adenylyltransferase [Lachnotalea sp. AF33-28]RHP29465.1 pantetheine-phosphate adenylyltransferase [Lachnotalea sp. AF33-28]